MDTNEGCGMDTNEGCGMDTNEGCTSANLATRGVQACRLCRWWVALGQSVRHAGSFQNQLVPSLARVCVCEFVSVCVYVVCQCVSVCVSACVCVREKGCLGPIL